MECVQGTELLFIVGFLGLTSVLFLCFIWYLVFKLDDLRYKYKELQQEINLKSKKR